MKRQGDLLIVKVNAIPEKAEKLDHLVLAEGEATGHFHKLDSGSLYEKDGILYFTVEENTKTNLNHPEHGRMTFEEGTYKVVRQVEYEPQGTRYVED